MGNDGKKCAFFGHRKIEVTDELKVKLTGAIERLITQEGVTVFVFGSRSQFDELCHATVTALQKRYPHLRRVAHPCKSEYMHLKGKQDPEKTAERLNKHGFIYQEYEEIKPSDRVCAAGKAAYVERNQEMIDESDFILFYYDAAYKPPQRKDGQTSAKSGTGLAYEYALTKQRTANKVVLNIFE
ncbi:MAG: hypothetical protein IJ514_05175 [Clostridia bacterium]|nr:hypothetical protein [Clostridia bacterium]